LETKARGNLIEFAASHLADTSLLAYHYEAQTCEEGGTGNFAAFSMGGHYSDPRNSDETFLIWTKSQSQRTNQCSASGAFGHLRKESSDE